MVLHALPGCWLSFSELPGDAQAEIERLVARSRADLAVVTQVELRRLGDGGAGGEADHRSVALRRGAIDGEAVGRRPGEGRRHRPAGVGVFVQPAQAQVERESALAAERNGAGEVG